MFPSCNCQECHGKGSQLIVAFTCPNNHKNISKSQPAVNRYSQGNLTLSAAVLFSANTFEGIATHFNIANGKSRFYQRAKLSKGKRDLCKSTNN